MLRFCLGFSLTEMHGEILSYNRTLNKKFYWKLMRGLSKAIRGMHLICGKTIDIFVYHLLVHLCLFVISWSKTTPWLFLRRCITWSRRLRIDRVFKIKKTHKRMNICKDWGVKDRSAERLKVTITTKVLRRLKIAQRRVYCIWG